MKGIELLHSLRICLCLLLTITLVSSMLVPVTILTYDLACAYDDYDEIYRGTAGYSPMKDWVKEFSYNMILAWFSIMTLLGLLFVWKTFGIPKKVFDIKKMKKEGKKK